MVQFVVLRHCYEFNTIYFEESPVFLYANVFNISLKAMERVGAKLKPPTKDDPNENEETRTLTHQMALRQFYCELK